MQPVLSLYKPVGITPLQLIESFRKANPLYQKITLGYAGRLDPMADGLLLVLTGEENKKRKSYERLPKSYSFDLLFGVTTDTYDTLGLFLGYKKTSHQMIQKLLPDILNKFQGKIEQPYPPFSSPRVNGKPLFFWAREGRIGEITIPKKQIEIFTYSLESLQEFKAPELRMLIFSRLSLITGNFRQDKILSAWETFFSTTTDRFIVGTFSVSCSSGTYVRSLCHAIGQKLGTGGIALRITRTGIGEFDVSHALKIPIEVPYNEDIAQT